MRILEKLAAASLATMVMGTVYALLAEGGVFHPTGLYLIITLYAAPVVYLLGISSSYAIEALLGRYWPQLFGIKAVLVRALFYGLAGAISTTVFAVVATAGDMDAMSVHEASTFYICGILTAVLYSLALAFVRLLTSIWGRIVCALGLPVSYLIIISL